ncbi:MAG: NTP transferase domain-containing protein, partial [Kangiellaceae bacterium]|nr:NTP transferase domain-containing protein [Kangiellaceae bacterium]
SMMLTLVVLAAGLSSRFGSDKTRHHVGPNGETLLEYSINDAIDAGFQKFLLIIRKDSVAFAKSLQSRLSHKVDLDWIIQPLPSSLRIKRIKPLGTAHALYCARTKVEGSLAVINGDDFYGKSSFKLLADSLNKSHNHCLVSFPLANTLSHYGGVNRGICRINNQGFLTSIEEMTDLRSINSLVQGFNSEGIETSIPAKQPISMNCWGFQKEIFDLLNLEVEKFVFKLQKDISNDELYLPDIVAKLPQNSVKVMESSEKWLGMTYSQDAIFVKKQIVNLLNNGYYSNPLWESLSE